jgi:hypothetical protein
MQLFTFEKLHLHKNKIDEEIKIRIPGEIQINSQLAANCETQNHPKNITRSSIFI